MFVCAFDKKTKKYYKSMVYGLINTGYYEQAILFNPYTDAFELIDYLDKESKEFHPLYECINWENDDWILYENAFLLKLKKYCKEHDYNGEIKCYQGYKEVFDNFEFMLELLQKREISKSQTTIEVKNTTMLTSGIINETIFWADEILEHEDTSYTGTWIKALNLKWRKIS